MVLSLDYFLPLTFGEYQTPHLNILDHPGLCVRDQTGVDRDSYASAPMNAPASTSGAIAVKKYRNRVSRQMSSIGLSQSSFMNASVVFNPGNLPDRRIQRTDSTASVNGVLRSQDALSAAVISNSTSRGRR